MCIVKGDPLFSHTSNPPMESLLLYIVICKPSVHNKREGVLPVFFLVLYSNLNGFLWSFELNRCDEVKNLVEVWDESLQLTKLGWSYVYSHSKALSGRNVTRTHAHFVWVWQTCNSWKNWCVNTCRTRPGVSCCCDTAEQDQGCLVVVPGVSCCCARGVLLLWYSRTRLVLLLWYQHNYGMDLFLFNMLIGRTITCCW